MKEKRYHRNYLYIDCNSQKKIKETKVLLAGAGLGSVIAECILRLGFENITIIDGDTVEESNLNRQNYCERDLGESKVESLKSRLLSINSKANISVHNLFIDTQNLDQFIPSHNIAVNALDFDKDVPLLFDAECSKAGIYVVHPLNLGWAALVGVIRPEGIGFEKLISKQQVNEASIVKLFLDQARVWNHPEIWLEKILKRYQDDHTDKSPPQLSIGSYSVAALTAKILYDISTGMQVDTIPKFYFQSTIR